MGFNTTVMFCNDAFSEIQKDPKGFVDKIREGMTQVRYNEPWY